MYYPLAVKSCVFDSEDKLDCFTIQYTRHLLGASHLHGRVRSVWGAEKGVLSVPSKSSARFAKKPLMVGEVGALDLSAMVVPLVLLSGVNG